LTPNVLLIDNVLTILTIKVCKWFLCNMFC